MNPFVCSPIRYAAPARTWFSGGSLSYKHAGSYGAMPAGHSSVWGRWCGVSRLKPALRCFTSPALKFMENELLQMFRLTRWPVMIPCNYDR